MPEVETKRLLILGGTGEAAELARCLTATYGKRINITTSFTRRLPGAPDLPGTVRAGGFGGAEGLADFLEAGNFDWLIDATHPFAAQISAHARAAAAALGLPRLQLVRPVWQRQPGDTWIDAADIKDAARQLPGLGRRAFLTIGSQDLAAFSGVANVWFLVRLIQPPVTQLADCHIITARGPYLLADEKRLLAEHRIDVLVSKASGGAATEAKIIAAREAALPVLMIRRPPPETGAKAATAAEAQAWIEARI